jgi:hypothetical protein
VQDSASPMGTGSQAFSGTVGGTTTTACGAPASGALPVRGNESSLTAPFAYVLAGADSNDNPIAWAGSFTPNGSGGITAADIDVVTSSVAEGFAVNLSGSSYSFGSDGRGCLYLAFTGPNPAAKTSGSHAGNAAIPRGRGKSKPTANVAEALPSLASATFSFSVSAPYETGRIQEFDFATSGMQAAGQMHQQTPADFALSKLNAHFVLGVTGFFIDATQATFLRTAMGASVTNTAGTITSPSADLNVDGTVSGQLSGGSGSFGTTVSSSTGRGTGSYTIPYGSGTVSFDFAYYVINNGDIFAITTDQPVTNNFVLSGRALSSSTSVSGLQGYYLAALSGLDASGSNEDFGDNVVSVATLQASSSGSITNATVYTNDSGTYGSKTYASATYVLDPTTGRATITNVTETPPVAYLTDTVTDDDIAGFLVGTDANASGGFLLLQGTSTPAFSTSSLSGGYIFGTSEDVTGITGSQVGQYDFTSGTFTGKIDTVVASDPSSSLHPDQAAAGSVTVNADGSGNFGGANIQIVTNGGVILGIDSSTTTQPMLYIWVAQTLVTP